MAILPSVVTSMAALQPPSALSFSSTSKPFARCSRLSTKTRRFASSSSSSSFFSQHSSHHMRWSASGNFHHTNLIVQDNSGFYSIIGVSTNASKSEIKIAYRKLGVITLIQPGAEQKFKEITNAYEVLVDDEKRSKYDRLGEARVHINVVVTEVVGNETSRTRSTRSKFADACWEIYNLGVLILMIGGGLHKAHLEDLARECCKAVILTQEEKINEESSSDTPSGGAEVSMSNEIQRENR